MATSRIHAKHNGRRSTKAFALSAVLSIVGVGLFAVNASAISGARLDTSFDSDGKVITSFGGYDFAFAVAIQADGKIVVAGTSDVNGDDDFALSRYNTDGTLDTSFDTDGKLTTNFGGRDFANSVAIQADGKIVVAGWSEIQNSDFALARYNTDGSLDTSFDTDGKLTTNFGGRDFAEEVMIQADGKIVVAGWSQLSPTVFTLARYNTDGSLDTSFDTDGKLTTAVGDSGQGNSAALQTDGKIVVAGLSFVNNISEFALARYNTDGSLDTSFDSDGKLTTAFAGDAYGTSVAIQLDGKIVVAGDINAGTSYQFALARYNTDGTLDTSFDSDGKLMTSVGDNSRSDGVSAAIQADGKIVAAGLSKASGVTDFGLARYNTDGTLDTSFDSDGKLTINFGGNDESALAVAIQPDGKIVAAGYSSEDTYSFAIARYDVTAVTPISQIGADIDGEAAGDESGNSVAMSADGTRIAIGAPYNGGNDAGHVRMYSWSGTAWTQTGTDIDGEAAGDGSGTSVAMSADGTRIAIGAPRNDGNGSDAGHVRVYSWSGTAWTQTGTDIDGEAAVDYSGYSVAMSADGNRLAIGAPFNDGNGDFAGHVRMYSWNGTAWTQTGTDIDSEATGDNSGLSVAMSADGTRIAIGAPFNDGNGDGAGHVRMYSWSGTAWTQTGTDIDGEATDDWSGYSVAMSADGTRIAVGALNNDGNGDGAGHVRMYSWNGTAWTQTGADIDGEAAVDSSGNSVAMSADGTRIAIGALNNDGNGDGAGHVRMYSWSGTAWTQTGADIDGEAAGDGSGTSVALSADGRRFASSAPYSGSGHVRIYAEQNSPTAPTITSVTAANGSLTVSFTPGNDGGSPITNYKYSTDGTNFIALNPATTTSPFTISGLTNGTTYSVTIKAVNRIGDSPASNAIAESPVAAATTVSGPSTTVPVSTTTVNNVGSLPETGSNSSILVIFSALFVISGMTLIRRRRVFSN